jgi:tripartite-type tricarboxylate transporter receptor subunit TctC
MAEWIASLQITRRDILQLVAAASVVSVPPSAATALDYPTRPVRIIVGFSAGSGLDICARLIGQWLSERLGQQFIVENKLGAGSNLATETVVNAAPDGYTLLTISSAAFTNATLYDNLNFNFIRDIAPIASLTRGAFVIVVNPLLPAKMLPAFIAYAKANPGKLTMASGGTGTPAHVAGELFNLMTGLNLVHVPYRGDPPALADLMAGQVTVSFSTVAGSIGFIRSGKLRALAVTTSDRSDALPEIPTVSEFVPAYDASFWNGMGAPKATPAPILETLNKEINAGLADPTIKSRLAELGIAPAPMTTAQYGALFIDQTDKWGKVIRAAKIKLD